MELVKAVNPNDSGVPGEEKACMRSSFAGAPVNQEKMAFANDVQTYLLAMKTADPSNPAAARLGQALLTSMHADGPQSASTVAAADAAAVGHALMALREVVQDSP